MRVIPECIVCGTIKNLQPDYSVIKLRMVYKGETYIGHHYLICKKCREEEKGP